MKNEKINILLLNTNLFLLGILSLFGGFSGTVNFAKFSPYLSLKFALYISIIVLIIQIPSILIMLFNKK